MPFWLQFIIIISVTGGIGFATFAMWMQFKVKQIELGSSMGELLDTIAAHQKALEAAERRFQNLEAIVTTQVWDAVHDEALPEAEKQRVLSQARAALEIPTDEPSDAERAERIARRLRS